MPFKTPILDFQAFLEARGYVRECARKVFEKDEHHARVIFLVTEEGKIEAFSYDQLGSRILPKTGLSTDMEKDVLALGMAAVAASLKAVGYFEVGEAYTMSFPPDTDLKGALRQYHEVRKKFGSIRQMPTRIEILYIRSRYKDKVGTEVMEIRRREDAPPVLLPFGKLGTEWEMEPYEPENVTRNYIDRAIDKILSGKESR